MKLLFVLAFSFVYTQDIAVRVAGENYSYSDFFLDFQKPLWVSSDSVKRTQMVDEFVATRIFSKEAMNIGLENNPSVRRDILSKKYKLILDESYEEIAILPLVPEDLFVSAKKHLKKERLVKHILFGFSGCQLPGNFSRSKDEAIERAFHIKRLFSEGKNIDSLVLEYSDDPGAKNGKLELGWFTWGKFKEPFLGAVFDTDIHFMSDPVLTSFGYHLVYIEDERPSIYSQLGSVYGNRASQMLCKKFVADDIPFAIEQYESGLFSKNRVVFSPNTISSIFNEIVRQKKVGSISGRTQLATALNEIGGFPVICTINEMGYGPKWFAEWLVRFPYSQRPGISSPEDLAVLLKTVVLQRLAVQSGLDGGLFNKPFVLNEYKKYVEKTLSESYVDYLESSIVYPDSAMVKAYYNDNKEVLYKKGEQVVIRELRVKSSVVADSLYSLLLSGQDFVSLAKNNSLTNPEEGGKVGPFPEGRYNKVGRMAFSLGLNEFCEPFQNLNRTWSIVMPVEHFSNQFDSLSSVYGQISLEIRDNNREKIVDDAFGRLKERFEVSVNSSFLEMEEDK